MVQSKTHHETVKLHPDNERLCVFVSVSVTRFLIGPLGSMSREKHV